MAQPGLTCPMQERKDAEQFHLQLPWYFTSLLKISQNRPFGGYLLLVILLAISKQDHSDELFPRDSFFVST